MTPASKEEIYLAKLCGEDWKLPYPASRLEYYYAKLCGMDVPMPAEPLSRPERYLAYLCGIDVNLPEPVSRKEMYMAKACGMDVKKLPEPLSKAERFWHLYIDHIETVSDNLPITIQSDGSDLIDYRIFGNSVQNKTPTPNNVANIQSTGDQTDCSYTISIICKNIDNENEMVKLTAIDLGSFPLFKVENYTDYIDFENHQIVRWVKKITLTGNEAIGKTSSNVFYMTIDNYKKDNTITCLCTHYISQKNTQGASAVNDKNCCFYILGDQNRFYIRDDDIETVDDFKLFLAAQYASGTPVTLLYVLYEPIIEKINLPILSTFNATTLIYTNVETPPSKMYIRYHQSCN